jgi:glutamine synthetase
MNAKDTLKAWLDENNIDEVEALVPDMAGVARGKFMPASTFGGQGGMKIPSSVFIQTVTGNYAEENEIVGALDRDLNAVPDLDTLRMVPWAREPSACVIHDVYFQDGSPVHYAPRQILRHLIDLYEERGLRPIVAPEVEFYLVQKNTDPDDPLEPPVGRSGRRETVRSPFSMDAIDEFEPLVDDIYDFCEAQQVMVDNLVHEAGAAQLEINFLHGDALALADQVFMFKRIVREVAMRHDVYATFMAKPMQSEPGSSMHWHISLFDEARNANLFSAADGNESPEFLHFIGGLQRYLPDFYVLCAPYVNSYRRIARWLAAPINLQWGYDNRTVGLRVPGAAPASRRIENRLAGADANPYLAITASLAAGYLGLVEQLDPRRPETGDAYDRPLELPRNLDIALADLEKSDAAKKILGEDFVTLYAAIKQMEFERFFEVVSPWEREYLLLSV